MFGYIGRHWRGELSLPQSYWVNGVLVGLPLNLYIRVVTVAFEANPPRSPSIYVDYLLLPLLAALLLAVWQGVGIWRSAGRRIAEGMYGWAWVARIVVLFNLAAVVYSAVMYGTANYSLLRASIDEHAAQYDIKDRGEFVIFHGEITEAGANELAPLLSRGKTQRLVVNASNGGFVQPSIRLAEIIHDRGLMVVALAQCASSCTGLLAAAKIRAIDPTAIVAMHRGMLYGMDQPAIGWEKIEAYYKSAGMTPALFAKMRAHVGQYDFYEPTIRELIAGGFVTHIYDPDAKRYFIALEWCARNKLRCDRTGRQNGETASHKD